MRQRMKLVTLMMLMLLMLVAFAPDRTAWAAEPEEPKRMVLVELYTSQGCDMCPTAEKVLGALSRTGPQDRADRLPCRLLQ